MPSFTFTEINSQPTVWGKTLAGFDAAELLTLWQTQRPQRVLFTGCGSTYYLSIVAANLFQALTGVPAQARPASELVLFPDLVFAPHDATLLVAISRSGTTTETLDAVRRFKTEIGGPVIVVTCDGNTPLVLVEALCGALAGQSPTPLLNSLPPSCERLLTTHASLAEQLGCAPGIERFFFLGSGFLYGMACEAMLKMKEMSLSYSEAFHCLEFRHGPMSMVNEHTLIVGLLSEPVQAHEAAVLRQMHERGAQVLALSEHGSGLPTSDRVHEDRAPPAGAAPAGLPSCPVQPPESGSPGPSHRRRHAGLAAVPLRCAACPSSPFVVPLRHDGKKG